MLARLGGLLPALAAFCLLVPIAAALAQSSLETELRRYGEEIRELEGEMRAYKWLAATTLAPTLITVAPTATTRRGHGRVVRKREQMAYLRANYDPLLKEMAAGKGETLDGLLALICPDAFADNENVPKLPKGSRTAYRQKPFGLLVQGRFSAIVPPARNPEALRENLIAAMEPYYVFEMCLF
ncbi:MAG: hypothetical protein V3S29_04015 [bacterium]